MYNEHSVEGLKESFLKAFEYGEEAFIENSELVVGELKQGIYDVLEEEGLLEGGLEDNGAAEVTERVYDKLEEELGIETYQGLEKSYRIPYDHRFSEEAGKDVGWRENLLRDTREHLDSLEPRGMDKAYFRHHVEKYLRNDTPLEDVIDDDSSSYVKAHELGLELELDYELDSIRRIAGIPEQELEQALDQI